MRLERSAGTIIHNRRFARRASAHSHFSYPNPTTHAAPSKSESGRRSSTTSTFSPGLPFSAASAVDPLNDSQFVAECAEGILNGIPDPVIGINRAGRIKTCNAAGSALIGQPASALVERPFAKIFCAENAWVAECVAQVRASRMEKSVEGAEIVFNGKRRNVNATFCPLMPQVASDPIGILVVLKEIGAGRQIAATMAHYINPDLIDRIRAGEGETCKSKDTVATILFADLRGFTTITEEIGAQKTVRLLNKYFTLMVDCISAENGAVDKFAGDSIMAGFGITRHKGDEEDRAVRAGIAMLKALDTWNTQRISEGRKPMQMGIGMATDLVVSGNIGSPKRMDYTLIGDGVNLASRLENACKQYGSTFLIAESTFQKLQGDYKIREIDEVVVVGRTQPVKIYEVLDHRTNPMTDTAMELFALARAHYLSGNWPAATMAFQNVLAIDPADKVTAHYIERCHRLRAAPPVYWNGIWTLDSK